ncbi:hypothetical protein C7B76_17260 [filamentous cyanobacterium CCP2]|nr:hypothetical protein C7B76_17260 [filamentous cyanobacterium CCP2]
MSAHSIVPSMLENTSQLILETIPPEAIPASQLRWDGASAEQLDFMRRVYERQVNNAAQRRSFVGDVPAAELAEIENGIRARGAAAIACREMLAAARADLQQQKQRGVQRARSVSGIRITSGYRSASQQFASWQNNFPMYEERTRSQREGLPGGQYGAEAVRRLASYIGRILGAPGYSLHNNGLAVDLSVTENGIRLRASSNVENIRRWRQSWFFEWLTNHAAQYHYYQNTAIDEPWHWEYRGNTAQPEQLLNHRSTSHSTSRVITAGRAELNTVPVLRSHRGTAPALILRWNDMTVLPDRVDVIIHLHGYSDDRDRMILSRSKEPNSGFVNPDDPMDLSLGRDRPTLAILPRGNYFGGRSGKGYDFPALTTPSGLSTLIDFCLQHFSQEVGLANLQMDRLILTAHSGGGAALMRILRHHNPHEVHVFDALYQDASSLIRWAENRIHRDQVALEASMGRNAAQYMREQGGALRVFYRSGTATEAYSLRVQRALGQVLPTSPSPAELLKNWYRAEPTRVPHGDIPRRYGFQLLRDASSAVR